MARRKTISPLLLTGVTFLLIGTAACVFTFNHLQNTAFDIDMSDEDESEYG